MPDEVELTLVRAADINSPRLFVDCASGKHHQKGVLAISEPNSDGVSIVFEMITFIDIVLVSMINKGSENGEQTPMEELKFEFSKLFFQVGEKADGWDFQQNRRL